MANDILKHCLVKELSTKVILKEIIDEMFVRTNDFQFIEKASLQYGSMGLNVIGLSALSCFSFGHQLSSFSIKHHIRSKNARLHDAITLTPSIIEYIRLIHAIPHESYMEEMSHFYPLIDQQFIKPHVLQSKSKDPVHFTEIAFYECDMLVRRLRNDKLPNVHS